MSPRSPRPRALIDVLGDLRAWHWMLLALIVLLVEYLTGPHIQFAILLVVPVAVAAAVHGARVGIATAVVLPLLRLSFALRFGVPAGWLPAWADAATDVVILTGVAVLVDRMLRQQREILILQGLLPICSFCKRIREEGGQWRQLETFIAERSDARFSHTFCEECGRKHYPELID